MPPSLTLELHERQSAAFQSRATEILYGGAAGGGKSHLLRVAAIAYAVAVPGLQVYLFRREFPDLFKNHMAGPAGFPALLAPWTEAGHCEILYSKNLIKFGNGSVINLCHCEHEKDVYGYQGAEIHLLLVDELTTFGRDQYTFLRSRVRLGGLPIPADFAGLFPRIIAGSNPGGVGHNWVKAMFVDAGRPMGVHRAAPEDGGMLRQFIPARLEDNPTLRQNDPEYEQRLQGLGDPALVKAMREGDWNIVAGGMFDDVWHARLALRPFAVPSSWRVDRSLDWGSSRPFSVGWWAESDGTPATLADGTRRTFPRGTLIRIGEWYGWDGKNPNVGLKLSDVELGRGIRDREREVAWGPRVKPGPADSMIFDVSPGHPSIAAEIAKSGITFTSADKRPGSRKTGWQAMRGRLRAAKTGDREAPGLYVFDTCAQFVRTIPVLPRDKTDRDDVDTNAEDHIADETRYRILAPPAPAVAFGTWEM